MNAQGAFARLSAGRRGRAPGGECASAIGSLGARALLSTSSPGTGGPLACGRLVPPLSLFFWDSVSSLHSCCIIYSSHQNSGKSTLKRV